METAEEKIAQLQKQLLEQEKMVSLGHLSAGIAHEIQNPLNFVINFSKTSTKLTHDLEDIVQDIVDAKDDAERDDLMDEMTDTLNDLRANMQKIEEHGQRAISIIRNILLQSRGKEDEKLPTDVKALVHEYVWLSYHAMRANDKSFNIAIEEDYQEGLPQFMVIPQDLCRAVLNVMNNACYAVRERNAKEQQAGNMSYVARIVTDVRQNAEGELVIRITDNGTGMPESVREKLFHEVITTKPIGQGTGLGMTITHNIIVNKHQGRIDIQSTQGEGTTFIFTIPAKTVK